MEPGADPLLDLEIESTTDVYALTDLSRTNVQALVEDPAVEDTRYIHRTKFRPGLFTPRLPYPTVGLQHNEDSECQKSAVRLHSSQRNDKCARKGVTQWETKVGKRIGTRVRNRKQPNKSKRPRRSGRSNKNAQCERNQNASERSS